MALLGLLGVVPLIILYMIRPRPRDLPFSSTVFISESEAQPSMAINRLITDPLFWIQLLIIILLVASAADPFTETKGIQSSHLVVVVDLSASMEASFDQAENIASRYISDNDRISIVLAENIPMVALREGNKAEAKMVLKSLSTRAVSADLSAGITSAKSLLGAEGGKILVISDFISWLGDDPEITRKLIEDDEVQVVFADSGGRGDNLAIVSGWIVESDTALNYSGLVRNFGNTKTVPIKISGPGGTTTTTRTIESGGDYYLNFDAYPGLNVISLELEDAISADNKAYVYSPETRAKKVLYLGDDGPALAALESLSHLSISRSGNYDRFDFVVIQNATTDGELNRYVYNGGRAIYIATNDTASPEYLPVKITGLINDSASLWVRNTVFAEDIHFNEISVFSYLETKPRDRSTTIVEANGVPLISYWRLGKGTVIYFGLDSSRSDFYLRPEYPVFWYEMINWLAEIPDAAQSNRRTGEIIRLGEEMTVDTPEGRVSTEALHLNQVGAYQFQGQTVVANMYDQKESDLQNDKSYTQGSFTATQSSEKVIERDIAPWLILLAVALFLLELTLIWRRKAA